MRHRPSDATNPRLCQHEESRLIAMLQHGLPLVSRPYAVLAKKTGMSEEAVIDCLGAMLRDGRLKRFGVVVRHHELGYRANAMVVWDVPDSEVNKVGRRLVQHDFVTLCYRRARNLPAWPYNLYCMIHGRDRATVREQIDHLIDACGLQNFRHEVLFSRRRFKQSGAYYGGIETDGMPVPISPS